MNGDIALLTIFVLSVFVGFEVISKVSTILHTPLMSGANAIHGVILVGAILVAGHAEGTAQLSLALVAVVLATINIVGGFVVTDRMLEMFRRPDARGAAAGTAPPDGSATAATTATGATAAHPAGGRR
jgi:NAD(P) transhydrogenase subunit alpha